MLKFVEVTNNNIKALFEINRQLALEEGQKDLFTAKFEDYAKGFLGDNPTAYGTLCFQDDEIVGFAKDFSEELQKSHYIPTFIIFGVKKAWITGT